MGRNSQNEEIVEVDRGNTISPSLMSSTNRLRSHISI